MSQESEAAQANLIYALLALDSYNRGYGAGISELDETGAIGNYSIRAFEPDEKTGWESAGFYAIAYRNTDTQEVVISYRGTDVPSPFTSQGDPTNAYGLALGNTPDTTHFVSSLSLAFGTTQSGLAVDFNKPHSLWIRNNAKYA